MTKRYFKGLKIIGKHFCLYNNNKTTTCKVYRINDKTYFKPRKTAKEGQTINGVPNMVLCEPWQNGTLTGYQETTNYINQVAV